MQYWLLKSEPDVFSIEDLKRKGTEMWDGVRNYQARNYLASMRPGDRAFFYHSNAEPPGVAGICEIVKTAYPDPSALDPNSKYYDPKATSDNPIWMVVDVRFREQFPRLVPLAELRETPGLEQMPVTQKGSRLSVQPVTPHEWRIVLKLARRKG
ncbi:MAG: EVE domain-containing protein [Candidatus Xenobia bacterium]